MITKLVAAFAVLVAMEPLFTLVVVAAGLAVILVTSVIRKNLKNLNKRVSEAEGRVSGFIQETLEKLLMVQAMDVSSEMEKRSEVHMEDRYVLQRKRKNVSLVSHTCVSVSSSFFIMILFLAFLFLDLFFLFPDQKVHAVYFSSAFMIFIHRPASFFFHKFQRIIQISRLKLS
jgi:ABC-type bacteriocin/lantibiotic exporter with double-glycine peptidase domain